MNRPSPRKHVFAEAANENGSTIGEHRDDTHCRGAHTAGTSLSEPAYELIAAVERSSATKEPEAAV